MRCVGVLPVDSVLKILSSAEQRGGYLQNDGLHSMQWHQAMATFCGVAARRYYTQFDIKPILCFIAGELLSGNVPIVTILQRIITEFSGVQLEGDMDHSLLLCLTGSFSLQMASLYPISTTVLALPLDETGRSTFKLVQPKSFSPVVGMRLLNQINRIGLFLPIFTILYQQSHHVCFEFGRRKNDMNDGISYEDLVPLKQISNLHDQVINSY